MKKLSILPLAEKVSISGANEPVYTKKGFGINIPDKVFLIMFIATCITLFIYPFAVFFMLGGVCFLYGINKAKTPPHLKELQSFCPQAAYRRQKMKQRTSHVQKKYTRTSESMKAPSIIICVYFLSEHF